jgi:hypothetical protein
MTLWYSNDQKFHADDETTLKFNLEHLCSIDLLTTSMAQLVTLPI